MIYSVADAGLLRGWGGIIIIKISNSNDIHIYSIFLFIYLFFGCSNKGEGVMGAPSPSTQDMPQALWKNLKFLL